MTPINTQHLKIAARNWQALIIAATISTLLPLSSVSPAKAWDRGRSQAFAILPDLPGKVPVDSEGLTVGPDGTVYTPSFGFNYQGHVPGPPHLFSFRPDGKLLDDVALVNSETTPQPSPNLVGLVFQPSSKSLLICDLADGIVWQANPTTGNTTVFMDTGLGAASGLNGLTFDQAGNVYVADSLQGVVWKVGPNGGSPETFVNSQLLSPQTVSGAVLLPSLGANGVEFSNDLTKMYVTNTAYHSIVVVPMTPIPDGSVTVAGPASILFTGLNAPDGLVVDHEGNLWVASNQGDEIDVFDPNSLDANCQPLPKLIAKVGDFDGLTNDGTIKGLLFPTSPAFSLDEKTLYVTNLALFQPYSVPQPGIDSAWTLQVRHYPITRIDVEIPHLSRGSGTCP